MNISEKINYLYIRKLDILDLKKFNKKVYFHNFHKFYLCLLSGNLISYLLYSNISDPFVSILFFFLFILSIIFTLIFTLIGCSKELDSPLFNVFKAQKLLKNSKYKNASEINKEIISLQEKLNNDLNKFSNKELILLLGLIKDKKYIELKSDVFYIIEMRNKNIEKEIEEDIKIDEKIAQLTKNSEKLENAKEIEEINKISENIKKQSLNKHKLLIETN